jgi:hypothetical protein
MDKLTALLIAITALAACSSETFTEIESPQAPLIAGFTSYAKPREVLPQLSLFSQPVVVENSALSANDRRPPFSIYSLSVRNFRHIEHSGELRLLFFNDRLQQTIFYPDNAAAYLAALKASGVAVSEGQELKSQNTVVWVAIDYQGRQYVGWGDRRLLEQSNRWISRYA